MEDLSGYIRNIYGGQLDALLSQLKAAYENNQVSARAQNEAQMGEALYNEYVRQVQAKEVARQAAQAQANWQAQFDYTRALDALSQQNWMKQFEFQKAQAEQEQQNWMKQLAASQAQQEWEKQKWQSQWDYQKQQDALDRQDWQTQQSGNLTSENREYAYKLAVSMLQNGLTPDSSTLTAAGISSENAQALANLYKTYTVDFNGFCSNQVTLWRLGSTASGCSGAECGQTCGQRALPDQAGGNTGAG